MQGFLEYSFDASDWPGTSGERNDLASRVGLRWESDHLAVRKLIQAAAESALPIPWTAFESHPLKPLLDHSDCDGEIQWQDCKAIAAALMEIYERTTVDEDPEAGRSDSERGVYDGMRMATKRFAQGAMRAFESQENIEFH